RHRSRLRRRDAARQALVWGTDRPLGLRYPRLGQLPGRHGLRRAARQFRRAGPRCPVPPTRAGPGWRMNRPPLPTLLRAMRQQGLALGLFALGAVLLLAAVRALTGEAIAEQREAAERRALQEVLGPSLDVAMLERQILNLRP